MAGTKFGSRLVHKRRQLIRLVSRVGEIEGIDTVLGSNAAFVTELWALL
eukprot:gene35142-45491_t